MHTTHPNRLSALVFVLLLTGPLAAGASDFLLPDYRPADGAVPRAAGKPQGSSVMIEGRTYGTATVGRPYPVTVDVTGVDERGARITFSSDATLTLTNARPITLRPGRTKLTVFATPSAKGLAFVNVIARQGTGGYATSIPVQVGPTPRASEAGPPDGSQKPLPPGVQTTPDGRAVRLPTLP